jgi:copper ion binding protein
MEKHTFNVPAIHCKHCVHTIQMELEELDGVNKVHADLDSKTVEVEFDQPATLDTIVDTLKEINYPPEM